MRPHNSWPSYDSEGSQCTFARSLARSLSYSFTRRAFTHSLINSLTHPPTHPRKMRVLTAFLSRRDRSRSLLRCASHACARVKIQLQSEVHSLEVTKPPFSVCYGLTARQ
jgi:hypothetical protein